MDHAHRSRLRADVRARGQLVQLDQESAYPTGPVRQLRQRVFRGSASIEESHLSRQRVKRGSASNKASWLGATRILLTGRYRMGLVALAPYS